MIREFHHADMDQVISIWLSASIIAHDFIPSEYWESKVEEMKNIYIPMSITWVFADKNSKILAFISLVDNYIAAIFVDPNEQGKGLGTQLIDFAKSSKPKLQLQVYKANTPSVEFYLKQGFKIEMEQIDENTGQSEIVMVYER